MDTALAWLQRKRWVVCCVCTVSVLFYCRRPLTLTFFSRRHDSIPGFQIPFVTRRWADTALEMNDTYPFVLLLLLLHLQVDPAFSSFCWVLILPSNIAHRAHRAIHPKIMRRAEQQSGSDLMKLPGELRLMIYGYLLDRGTDETPEVHPQILATCRELHREAESVLYTSMTFHLRQAFYNGFILTTMSSLLCPKTGVVGGRYSKGFWNLVRYFHDRRHALSKFREMIFVLPLPDGSST